MKKLLAVLICLSFCLCVLSSCNTKEPPEEADVSVEESLASLSQFFVNEGLVPGLSQRDMRLNMEKYSYQGEKLTEIVAGMHYDGLSGGGLSANGELFGYNNDYDHPQDSDYANYNNSFYTKVSLDGLTLPLEISFGDSVATVIEKLGFAEDALDGLVLGEEKSLYHDGKIGVTLLYNGALEETPNSTNDSKFSYVLQYKKMYESTRASGNPVTVTETMKLSFVGEGDPLAYFYVEVNENYKH
ncbi:MAG: hypothetical protein IJX19_04540 [Clostridia bacterium]|nr:hypothetical protein [Clostridia bacterium]